MMRFDSALELQARVFSEIFSFVEIPAAAGMTPLPGLFMASADAARAPGVKRRKQSTGDLALGVSAGAGGDDARLAVLIQSSAAGKSTLVKRIVELARGEAEIVFIGRQKPLWTRVRNDPVRIGCSVSPATVNSAGTFGCFCSDQQTGKICMLSNNHVLADVNRVALGTPISQPGRFDNGSEVADLVAELTRFIPIQFGGIPNAVDAAIAAMTAHGRVEDRATIFDSADSPGPVLSLVAGSPATASPGMTVFKTGRTTRHTRGRVAAVNVNNYLVNMGAGLGVARFDNQIVIEMDNAPAAPFSRGGDSGSLIVEGSGRPVGLLFAGSETGGAGNIGFTGANPISSVMTHLGVTLI